MLALCQQSRGRSRQISQSAIARQASEERRRYVDERSVSRQSPSLSPPISECSSDYWESPPSPPQSLADQVHVAYAHDDLRLAKILLLRLKGIEVTSDHDPRIDDVCDEDFDFCFVPNGKLMSDEDERELEERRQREVTTMRIRRKRTRHTVTPSQVQDAINGDLFPDELDIINLGSLLDRPDPVSKGKQPQFARRHPIPSARHPTRCPLSTQPLSSVINPPVVSRTRAIVDRMSRILHVAKQFQNTYIFTSYIPPKQQHILKPPGSRANKSDVAILIDPPRPPIRTTFFTRSPSPAPDTSSTDDAFPVIVEDMAQLGQPLINMPIYIPLQHPFPPPRPPRTVLPSPLPYRLHFTPPPTPTPPSTGSPPTLPRFRTRGNVQAVHYRGTARLVCRERNVPNDTFLRLCAAANSLARDGVKWKAPVVDFEQLGRRHAGREWVAAEGVEGREGSLLGPKGKRGRWVGG